MYTYRENQHVEVWRPACQKWVRGHIVAREASRGVERYYIVLAGFQPGASDDPDYWYDFDLIRPV